MQNNKIVLEDIGSMLSEDITITAKRVLDHCKHGDVKKYGDAEVLIINVFIDVNEPAVYEIATFKICECGNISITNYQK